MLNYSYRSYNSHVSQPQRWEDLHKMPPEIVVHSLPPCFAALRLQCVCEELVLQMAIHLEVYSGDWRAISQDASFRGSH